MGNTIKYVGEEVYSGWDGDEIVNLSPGETAEVSDAKAAQITEDRPYEFEVNGQPAQRRPHASPVEETPAGDSIDTLMKLNRAKLDEKAAELGITAPAAMADKRTVALAILAALEDPD